MRFKHFRVRIVELDSSIVDRELDIDKSMLWKIKT